MIFAMKLVKEKHSLRFSDIHHREKKSAFISVKRDVSQLLKPRLIG